MPGKGQINQGLSGLCDPNWFFTKWASAPSSCADPPCIKKFLRDRSAGPRSSLLYYLQAKNSHRAVYHVAEQGILELYLYTSVLPLRVSNLRSNPGEMRNIKRRTFIVQDDCAVVQ